MVKIRAVIFDLDNTLYDERDYLLEAYHNIARCLSKRYFLEEHEIYRKLVKDSIKKTSMYSRLFNDLLDDLGLDQQILPSLLEIFVDTKTNLKLRATAEKLLDYLKEHGVKLGLLTNGTVKAQINKVCLLGIEGYFDVIVYSRELGREYEKPSPNAYIMILNKLGVQPEDSICIGDNPYTDFWGAKRLGMLTVRLLRGEFKGVKLAEEFEADRKVRTLKEFYYLLERMNLTKRV